MNLSRLSNQALHENFQKLASTEREILTQIILHIQEVHRRKLYLELGYSSLYLYMTEHLKYSSASAMRRIEAAKLVHDIPCVLQKLEEGKINLSQVSLLQHSLKVAQKNKSNISAEYKLELIESLEGLNKQQSEVKLSASLEIPVQKHTSTK